MADLYLKAIESERRQLWATCRLKGLARDTPERMRIAALDEKIAEHKAKNPAKAKPKAAGKAKTKAGPKPQPKAKPKSENKADKPA